MPTLTAADPEALALRASGGCRDSLADLCELYQDQVYRWHLRRTRDHHLAEELSQDTWLNVARGITTFQQGRRPFVAWLFTVARNAANDYGRVTVRRPERITADLLELDQPTPADAGPESTALRRAEAARLVDGVKRLPARQAEAVLLCFFEGLSITEAAAVLGITVNALKVRRHRAIGTLRSSGAWPTMKNPATVGAICESQEVRDNASPSVGNVDHAR